MRPQAVCTFALCSLSSKNPDGLSCLGLIAIALASLQFAIKLILGLMSTMMFIGADFFTFLFGLYYGTGLQRAAKVSKQQAARASPPPHAASQPRALCDGADASACRCFQRPPRPRSRGPRW